MGWLVLLPTMGSVGAEGGEKKNKRANKWVGVARSEKQRIHMFRKLVQRTRNLSLLMLDHPIGTYNKVFIVIHPSLPTCNSNTNYENSKQCYFLCPLLRVVRAGV